MITGFHHSGFVVQDLERMVDFYCNVLGLRVEREIPKSGPREIDPVGLDGAVRAIVFVGGGDTPQQLELERYLEPTSPDGHAPFHALGAAHVCFNVDDLDATLADLSTKGVGFLTPPVAVSAPPGFSYRLCCALDPEGNRLEFREYKEIGVAK